LIYHRVLPETDPLFPCGTTAESFDAQLSALKGAFNVLPLGEAVERLKSASLPPRAACITFDDGYADNATVALPILRRHGLPATFFIASAYLNGGRMFNDTVIHAIRNSRDDRIDLSGLGLGEHDLSTPTAKRLAIGAILNTLKYRPLGQREEMAEEVASLATSAPPPNDLMLRTEQLQALEQAGMEIGGHTAHHPILAKLDDASVAREVAEGRDEIEALLTNKVKLFAYPNGRPVEDYLPTHTEIIRKLGFSAAVSTQWGAARHNDDMFQLPRFTPYTTSMLRFSPMLFQNFIRDSHYANV
jgi:peptidoglycan/xylan/chitin deacetylase (PgdA/CDA1 family)